ncbi:MAG TPA: addiction module protein [Phycisphaerae bacterium]|nr:addiction module protein [Phycisphaerae bacterium]
MTVEELESQAMKLSARQRALLAEHLLASLEEDEGADVEAAWLNEARKRRRAFRKGNVSKVAADAAIKDARAKLG